MAGFEVLGLLKPELARPVTRPGVERFEDVADVITGLEPVDDPSCYPPIAIGETRESVRPPLPPTTGELVALVTGHRSEQLRQFPVLTPQEVHEQT